MYRQYFPLIALTTYKKVMAGEKRQLAIGTCALTALLRADCQVPNAKC